MLKLHKQLKFAKDLEQVELIYHRHWFSVPLLVGHYAQC
jgi:hypothetical protein